MVHRQDLFRAVRLFALFGCCGLAGLLACDPPPQPTAAIPAMPAMTPACTLFTEADAMAVLAEPEVVVMKSFLNGAQGKPDPTLCGYNAGSDPSLTVRLEVRRSPSAERAARAFASTRSLLAGSAPQDVAGLGDGAFWAGGSLAQLHVRRGATQLIVTSQTGEGKDALAIAREIAGKALARL